MTNDRSNAPDHADLGTTAWGVDPTSGVEVVRSEERLVAGVERHVTGSVRIGKRVVSEERTVTVTVRREELFVEHVPAGAATGDAGTGAPPRGAEPVVTLTLAEEEPVVTVRTVPRETVRLFVDRLTVDHSVTEDVAREVVEHDVLAPGGGGVADR